MFHGLHVHTYGILDPSQNVTIRCGSSGTHFNPVSLTHGDVTDVIRHVGDYGNVGSDNNGRIVAQISDKISKLSGPFSIIGRTVVLHQLQDDLGRGSNPDSKLTGSFFFFLHNLSYKKYNFFKIGNSGARIACGVVGISS